MPDTLSALSPAPDYALFPGAPDQKSFCAQSAPPRTQSHSPRAAAAAAAATTTTTTMAITSLKIAHPPAAAHPSASRSSLVRSALPKSRIKSHLQICGLWFIRLFVCLVPLKAIRDPNTASSKRYTGPLYLAGTHCFKYNKNGKYSLSTNFVFLLRPLKA